MTSGDSEAMHRLRAKYPTLCKLLEETPGDRVWGPQVGAALEADGASPELIEAFFATVPPIPDSPN